MDDCEKYADYGVYSVSGSLVDTYGRSMGDFSTETRAISPAKAKSNALFQAKKQMNLGSNAGVKWYKAKVTRIE